MKEKLIRKVYHFQGILDGIAIVYVVALTIASAKKHNHEIKPLKEQRERYKEIH